MSHSITVDHEENPVNSKPCISKVHVGLRNVKPKAYDPVLVSIGPYHKANPDLQAEKQEGKPDLQAMQKNKKLYLNLLLKRRKERPESREIYLAELKKFDSEARNCYVDPMDSNTDDFNYPKKNTDDFVEMMLLDGCFIVEFLRKMDRDVKVEFDKDDPIKRVPWMKNQILSDMMLLENQLPYFVLSKVYNMTKSDEGEKPLEEMVMSCFNFMLPRPRLNFNNAFGNIGEINHLLHLIHVSCRPFPEETIKRNEDSNSGSDKNLGIEESSGDQTCCPLLPPYCDCSSDKSYEMKNQMGTVVELQEAGVKFKKVGKIYNGKLKKKTEEDKFKKVGKIFNCALKKTTEDDYVSLFDIDFKRGVMKVPCFKVDDTTETLFRNLIAYEQQFEQHFPKGRPKYFTDFACLMNQLINSKEDAKVLRFEKIIMNFLGDDDELSKLFNKLGDGVCESDERYDDEVRREVVKHCKTKCNVLMAKLRREYFNNPWTGISTFAAALLLLLTVGLFVVAVLTLRAT